MSTCNVGLRAVLDVCLPPHCVRCADPLGSARGLVCARCWGEVERLEPPLCERCGHPVAALPCRWCHILPQWVATCRSWCWVPDGAGGDLVHALKYDGWERLGDAMGARVATRPPSGVSPATALLVIPVPISDVRRRERGYNQAARIARGVAAHWKAEWAPDAVRRASSAESQVRLTPSERSANVQEAFAPGSSAGRVSGRCVVLVDDVVTTAATLIACADVLRSLGATALHFATFGRARAAWDRPTPAWS
jgi:ComF family protein